MDNNVNYSLDEKVKWSLDQKIDHAVGVIEQFYNKTGGKCYVSFSGGKDSCVLLDIVRRFVNKDVVAVFCNTGNEYPEIIKFVRTIDNVVTIRPKLKLKDAIEKWGFPLISKLQSQYIRQAKYTKSKLTYDIRMNKTKGTVGSISDKWKFVVSKKFDVSDKCCVELKKKPFHKFEKESGLSPILGIMATESSDRKRQYIQNRTCNYVSKGRKISSPLSIFTDDDIWNYIKRFNVKYCSLYDNGFTRTGCMFCGFGLQYDKGRFNYLKENHPKLYNTISSYTNNGIKYEDAIIEVFG